MKRAPNVSVVIPTFNRRNLVIRAVESVANQNYRNFDIWIVDDGSSDDTEQAITRAIDLNKGSDIHYIRQENQGVAAARNRGMRESAGKWIALLDSDDQWTPDKLETQLRYAEEHPEYHLIHSDETWIRNGARVNPPRIYQKAGGDIFRQSLPVCLISPSTVLLSRRLFVQTGGFNEEYPVCEDYELWLRITSAAPVGFVSDALTIKYGGHSDQLSTNHIGIDYWRIRALCQVLKTAMLTQERRDAVLDEIHRKSKILLKGYMKYGRKTQYRATVAMIQDIDPAFPINEDFYQIGTGEPL